MKKYILLQLILSGLYLASAQDCNKAAWARAYGGLSTSNAIVDGGRRSDGTFTVCGSYGNSTLTLETLVLPDSGNYHCFLANHDSSGTFLNGTVAAWFENTGEYCVIRKIDVGVDNSVYITGYWNGSSVHVGGVLLPSATRNRVFVAKFDASLQSKWVRYSDWRAADCQANDVASDQNKNVFIVGSFEDNAFKMGEFTVENYGGWNMWRDDCFFMKFDSLGNIQYLKHMGTENDDAGMSIVADQNGDVVIFGHSTSATTLFHFGDHFAVPGATQSAMFMGKFSGVDGRNIWGKYIGGYYSGSTIYASDACLAENNNIIISGQMAGQINFYPNSYTTTDNDGFVAKIDSDGNNLWLQRIGGQNTSENATRCSFYDGKIAVSGSLYSNQPYVGDFPLYSTQTGGSFKAFNAMFNTLGQTLWARGNNPSTSTYYNGCPLIDNSGNQILWGNFTGTQSWYPLSLTNSLSNYKLFMVKFESFTQSTAFTVNAGPDKETTCGTSIQLNGSTTPTTIAFGWYPDLGFSSNGNKTPYVNPGMNTTYYLYGTYLGCTVRDTVNVSYTNSEITVDAGSDIQFCRGDSIQVNTTCNQPTATYSWLPAIYINTSTSQSPYVKPLYTTSYVVTATYNGCKDIDTIRVYARPLPYIDLPKQDLYYSYYRTHLCAGNSLEMNFGDPLNIYTVTTPDVVANVNNNLATLIPVSGALRVQAVSPYGCLSKDSLSVVVHNNLNAPPVEGDLFDRMVCVDDTVYFQIRFTNSINYTFQYSWYSGWQVDSLDGSGWRDINFWDRNYEMTPYSSGSSSSTYYSNLKIVSVKSNMNGFKYRPYISDYCSPRGYGDSAVLYVGPKITTQPLNKTLCQGATDSISVNTTSVSSTYNWEIRQGNSFVPLVDQPGVLVANGRFLRIENASTSIDSTWVRCLIQGCNTLSVAYTDSVLIRVVASPQILFESPVDTICQGDSTLLTVSVQSPQLYTYRWYENDVLIMANTSQMWGYNTNTLHFTPANVLQNSKIYKCKISNAQCSSGFFSNPLSIYVDTVPAITWSSQAYSACNNQGAVLIPEATPSGGVYIGTYIVNGNSFNTSGLNAGNYTIQYSFMDSESGCNVRANRFFTINAAPNVVWSGINFALCEYNHAPFALSGATPSGGIYQGEGVYPTNMFYPDSVSVGTHEIRYIYTQTSTGCSDTAVQNVVISAQPNVSWSGSDLDYCINEPVVTLSGGLPTGGVYQGTGISGGTSFNPSVAGAGVFEIKYVYTESSSGCKDTATKNISVYSPPTVTWTSVLANCCLNDQPIALSGGLPAGGVYQGTGVIGGTSFNPSVAGAGIFEIKYVYTESSSGCKDTATKIISVYSLPTVTWTSVLANCCLNDQPIPLSGGLPTDGTYSGTGVSQNSFNPSIAGLGTHPLTYTYIDPNNCSSSANQSITVDVCSGISEQQGEISVWTEAGQIMFSQNHYFEAAFSVKVYDTQGQLVLSRDFKGDLEKSPISQNKLAKGLYYVHFTNGTTVKMFKVIN